MVKFSEQMANAGKTVIVAALDGTFLRQVSRGSNKTWIVFLLMHQAFGSVLDLVPICESVVKLNAVCMSCFAGIQVLEAARADYAVENAAFSKRISAETAIEVIGGSDKYLAVCRKCYHGPEVCAGIRNSAAANHTARSTKRLLTRVWPISISMPQATRPQEDFLLKTQIQTKAHNASARNLGQSPLARASLLGIYQVIMLQDSNSRYLCFSSFVRGCLNQSSKSLTRLLYSKSNCTNEILSAKVASPFSKIMPIDLPLLPKFTRSEYPESP